MSIDFYTFNTPNGRKISVALEEMELPYQVHVVNITKDQQFEPAFLNLSPNNKIPAIVDPDGPGGQPISVFESGAILLYLGEKTGRFLPKDLRAITYVAKDMDLQVPLLSNVLASNDAHIQRVVDLVLDSGPPIALGIHDALSADFAGEDDAVGRRHGFTRDSRLGVL